MTDILEINGISKNYAKHQALNNVSFNIPKGSVFGLLGPNGAGKTSLIRIITRITRPDTGQILFDGEPLKDAHIALMGYLPEERGLYKKMKVIDQLRYLAQLRGLSGPNFITKLKFWLQKFELTQWADKKVEDLSKGMQQKVQFISTVLHEPKLIILDEPFSGFDPINANLVRDEILTLRNNGATIIFSTHRMESVEELCTHIALINNAELVLYGLKDDLRHQYKNNIFVADGYGTLPQDPPETVEIVEITPGEADFMHMKFRLAEGAKPNQLLNWLTTSVSIINFSEQLPSMSQIFINTVNKQK